MVVVVLKGIIQFFEALCVVNVAVRDVTKLQVLIPWTRSNSIRTIVR